MAGLEIAMAGALVGFAVGMTGMGGGALMAPLLVLGFGVDPLSAVSADLLTSLAMKPLGAWVHARRGTVHWRIVLALCCTSVPVAFVSAALLHHFGSPQALEPVLQKAMGAALLLACAATFARSWLGRGQGGPDSGSLEVRWGSTLVVGAVGGFFVGTTSVGAGSLIMALLLMIYPSMNGSTQVGTDLVQAIPLVAAAALGHLMSGGIHLALTGWLLLGGLPAVYLGARLSAGASTNRIRLVLFAVILASGLQMLSVPTGLLLAVTAVGVTAHGLKRWGELRSRAAEEARAAEPREDGDLRAELR